jgi:hypothetical protein
VYPYKLHYICAYKFTYRNLPNSRSCVDVKIKPKYLNTEDVTLRLSFKSRKTLEHYSDLHKELESPIEYTVGEILFINDKLGGIQRDYDK